jgi:hypothetical protein
MNVEKEIDSLTRVAKLHSKQIGQLQAAMRTQAKSMRDEYKRTQEQFRRTDERVERLVSAIGELIRQVRNGKKA